VPGENGAIEHAQLVFGNGMIMLGSVRDDVFGKLQKSPTALRGVNSQSACIIVDDADKHYARAVAAGAKVACEIRNQDFGGRGYSCLDPEGCLWNFGAYDPWTQS
jgi:uncharacterized glyoxalase superfamily protein PhnB